ncbi:MAG: lipocalin family protein [Bacteroidales bacterium]|nr:lipocalin family protein [Bacteroidales bacterium]
MFLLNIFAPTEIDNEPVAIDLNKYLGKWYEIARFDHSFERDMQRVMAEYILMPDGKIKVINTGYRDGKFKESIGKAKLTETPGLLRVSFFMNFYSDYRVLMIDKDYNYVLVGGNSPKYLWILSRTPQLEATTLQKIIDVAEEKGYDTDNLIYVEQL